MNPGRWDRIAATSVELGIALPGFVEPAGGRLEDPFPRLPSREHCARAEVVSAHR